MNAVRDHVATHGTGIQDTIRELTGLPDDVSDPSNERFEDDDEFEIPADPSNYSDDFSELHEHSDDEHDGDGEDFTRQETRSREPGIDEGDFYLPEQRYVFSRLKMRIRQACNVNGKKDVRSRALEWIFVPNQEDVKRITFAAACAALGARPIVIQARTMHQLWKANIHLSEPLPFLAIPLPISLVSEISARIGPGLPEDMAKQVWKWPSIPLARLREHYPDDSDSAFKATLDSLIADGYVGVDSARAYFISRNPSILSKAARERFSFSSSIYGD